VLLPAIAALRQAAPGTQLAVLPLVPPSIAQQAEQGQIDLALHTVADAPPGLRRRTLFAERYVLVGRAGHPRLRRRPSLAQFCALEHVIVSPDGGGFSGVTDAALRAHGLRRRVVLSVPNFLFVVTALQRSDLIAMLPERLVRNQSGLQACAPPLELPGYEMAMLWHERVHRDPAHRWLREHLLTSI